MVKPQPIFPPAYAQRALEAMRWLEAGNVPAPWHRTVVAFSAHASPRGGTFRSALASLRAQGKVSYPEPNFLVLEQPGRESVDPPEGYWTLLQYHRRILARYPDLTIEHQVLQRIIGYPGAPTAIEKSWLASVLGTSPYGLRDSIAQFCRIRLVAVTPLHVVPTVVLFPRVVERRAPSEGRSDRAGGTA